MSTPLLQPDTIPEVGSFYLVPCARAMAQSRDGEWRPNLRHPSATAANKGWVPVIGEVHEDREMIGFQPDHIHVDVRFAWLNGEDAWRVMSQPLVARDHSWDEIHRSEPTRFEFMRRRLRCKRPGQLFPVGVWTPKLEQAHAGCRVGADGLCPHRGIPIAAGEQLPDGSMVCPGHGLRWGKRGQLLRRREL